MMKNCRVLILILFLIVCVSSCDKTPQGEDGEEMSKYTQEEFDTVLVTGIDISQFSQNDLISDWIELCSQEERDEIGNYALKYTEAQGDLTVYKYLIYRTDVQKSADIDVEFSGNNVLQAVVSYESTDTDSSGQDMTYLQFSVSGDVKVTLDVYTDGDYPGCVITSTEYDIGGAVDSLEQ